MNKAVRLVVLSALAAWSFGGTPAFARQYVHEHESVPVPQELGKEDTVKLKGFHGSLVRKTRGCNWVIDDLGALVIDAETRIAYTFTRNHWPCHVLVENVGSLTNDGSIALQGVMENEMQCDPPADGEAATTRFRSGGSFELRGVAYSGEGAFVLPVEKNTVGAVSFTNGRLNTPIRLEITTDGPLTLPFRQEVVRMYDTTLSKGLRMDNAVVLTESDVGGVRLRIRFKAEPYFVEGKKRMVRTWFVEGQPPQVKKKK